jgi:hypothetical protein
MHQQAEGDDEPFGPPAPRQPVMPGCLSCRHFARDYTDDDDTLLGYCTFASDYPRDKSPRPVQGWSEPTKLGLRVHATAICRQYDPRR